MSEASEAVVYEDAFTPFAFSVVVRLSVGDEDESC